MAARQSGPEQDRPLLLYAVGRIDQGIRREMQQRLADWDLSIPEYTLLSVLKARPGLSNAQLSRRALIMPQSMIEILASLEQRGLVVRATGADHSRILRAELAPAGLDALAGAEPAIRELEERLLSGVSARHRGIALRGLISMMERLSESSASDPADSRPRGERPLFVYAIGRINQGVRREMRERLAPSDLSIQGFTTLAVLRARPGLSNAQLSRRALITPQSMIAVLGKLEQRGLVARAVDPDHSRILRTTLTEVGLKALEHAEPPIMDLQRELLRGLPARHREILLEVLLSVMARLSVEAGDRAAA